MLLARHQAELERQQLALRWQWRIAGLDHGQHQQYRFFARPDCVEQRLSFLRFAKGRVYGIGEHSQRAFLSEGRLLEYFRSLFLKRA